MEEPAAKRRICVDQSAVEEVEDLERVAAVAVRELATTQSPEVLETRLAHIAERGLDDDGVERALNARRLQIEEAFADEGRNDDTALGAKIRASTTQLYKVLLRKRIAVLQGRPLPPLDSVFARLPGTK